MKTLYLLFLSLLALFSAVSCQKTFTLPPLSSTPTATYTPTTVSIPSTCSPTSTPGPPPNGIFWYSAHVQGVDIHNGGATLATGFLVDLFQTVNGAPEATASVQFNGFGLSAAVPYLGNFTRDGNVYARYQLFMTGPWSIYQAGVACSLQSTTSIGTASANLTGPGNISVATDGSSAGWSYSGTRNSINVFKGPDGAPYIIYKTGPCVSEVSPHSLPTPVYGINPYNIGVNCEKNSNIITGGTGHTTIEQTCLRIFYQNTSPTPTPRICGALTCTPTPIGTVYTDTFTDSAVVFQPAVSNLGITVVYPSFGGPYSLTVNSVFGAETITLDYRYLSAPLYSVYTWAGTDSYGSQAPDGVFAISAIEPFDRKLILVLLDR